MVTGIAVHASGSWSSICVKHGSVSRDVTGSHLSEVVANMSAEDRNWLGQFASALALACASSIDSVALNTLIASK